MKYILWITLSSAVILVSSCADRNKTKILVFSKTEGFRHESISTGIEMFKELGSSQGFEVDASEDADVFTAKKLSSYVAVVFLNTSGDILNAQQEYEFRRFIQAGGGFLGIHAAADTEYEWPWYGALVGAYFNGHPNNPNVREAVVEKTENQHSSTTHLPDRWDRSDEWYNYKSLNPNLIPVLNLDETSYEGGTNGTFHPISWYHEFDGGRSFYSGGGHTIESYQDENFRKHISEAIEWVMGDRTPVDYDMTSVMPEENRFVKQELDSYFNEPMELDLLPDGRIVFVERKGAIKVYDPTTESTRTVTNIDVYSGQEDGLIGMAIDPDYERTRHIFLCYSHPTEVHQSVSRFTFDPDATEDNVLTDERVVITVPTQRDECCHSGGSVEFDHNGYLWASFGDDTNPHQSSGYSPTDEQPGRAPFDAQKSSANTQDLRGKIIRIKVNEDGTYTIPDGNLFAKDGSEGRPEIYVMGCRNPFRFSIDPESNYVYWGEVGPDGREDGPGRGPRGYDEVNQAKEPGFFGWPLFIADNKAYNEYDFATSTSGLPYDPDKPINNSPNNTGVSELPPARKAMIWYPYAKSEEFPLVGSGGRNAMAGPVYHHDIFDGKSNRFPEYYDDKLFIYDWMRGWMMAVSFDDNGNMTSMEPFLPSIKWNNLMDVVMSPDGDFYTLEYGSGWFTANENAILSHLKYNPGNRKPEAKLVVNETAHGVPFTAKFDASQSIDSDDDDLKYTWDFGDGSTGTGDRVEHVYAQPGTYTAQVTVQDRSGSSSTARVKILAGNTPPEVKIVLAGNQNFYFPGQSIAYEVQAFDSEDGAIDPQNIALSVDYLEMGHDLTSIAQGHMSLSQLKSGHPGQVLIGKSDCVSCHKIDGISVGPSYKKIAAKYSGDSRRNRRARRISYLAEKIVKGGGGVWGETAMAAHPDIKPKEAAQMANYIMSLGMEKEELVLPSSGQHVLTVPEGKEPGGKFVLMASYTDKGADGVEPLRSFANVILRDATISSVDYTKVENATKMTITEEMVPGLEKPYDIVILNDEAHLEYDNIDLSGISSISMAASAPAIFAAGGSFNIFLDDVSSDPIFSGTINMTESMGGTDEITIPLEGATGTHKMIVVYKSNKKGVPVGSLISWSFIPESML